VSAPLLLTDLEGSELVDLHPRAGPERARDAPLLDCSLQRCEVQRLGSRQATELDDPVGERAKVGQAHAVAGPDEDRDLLALDPFSSQSRQANWLLPRRLEDPDVHAVDRLHGATVTVVQVLHSRVELAHEIGDVREQILGADGPPAALDRPDTEPVDMN